MRLICISDTHNKIGQLELPKGDLLLIAGDLTGYGTVEEFVKLNADLEEVKKLYKYGILAVPGNHDFGAERDFNHIKALLTNVKYFIHHEEVIIGGVKFFGSGYSPRFYDWAYNVDRGPEIAAKWSQIPNDCDVLITHGPCYGILDETPRGENVGCKDLLDAVIQRPSIKVVIGGHIHFSHGVKDVMGKTFINASSCNEKYMPINKPIEIEV